MAPLRSMPGIARPARMAAFAACLALAGCYDAQVTIDVKAGDAVEVLLTQNMNADFWAMMRENEEGDPGSASRTFCPAGTLTERADGGASCAYHEEGPFAAVKLEAISRSIDFTVERMGPHLVRVSFSGAGMAEEIGAGEDMDEEARAMIASALGDYGLSIEVHGGPVLATNMDETEEGASWRIGFRDVFEGRTRLPEEVFVLFRQ